MLGNIKSREYMFVVRLRNYLHLSFLVIFLLFSSCVDEFYKDTPKEGYIKNYRYQYTCLYRSLSG